MDWKEIVDIVKVGKDVYDTVKGDDDRSSSGFIQPRSIRSGSGTSRRPRSGRTIIAAVNEMSDIGQNPAYTYNTIVGSTLRKYRTITGT
tara:strand:- start:131 stop:397 length:267 start_codon:yes stop_codon:yes gene_type:complete